MTLKELELKCRQELSKRAIRAKYFEAIDDKEDLMFTRGQMHMCALILGWIQECIHDSEESTAA